MKMSRFGNSKWLVLILLNSAFIQAGVYVVRPMVSYRALELGANPVVIGLIGSAFAIAPLIFAITLGKWVDRGRDGLALLIGSSIALVIGAALIAFESLNFLFLAMPVLGIGHLLAMLGGQTMIANRSVDNQYERNFGLLTFYASIGHAVGPFIGGVLADRGGVEVDENAAIAFSLVLFLLAALSVAAFARVDNRAVNQPPISGSAVARVMAIKGYKSAIFVAGSATAVVDVLLVFLPVLGRELGFSSTQIGILLAIRAVASMGVRVILGRISDALGMRLILNAGALLTLVGMLGLTFLTNFYWLAIILAITGFAMGIGQPVTMAWVSRISQPENRGLAISIRLTSNRLGQVVVPAIAGSLASFGLGSVFILLATLQAGSILVTSKALPKS
jgi:MFS family permease